jgi:hypothetical protein
MATRTLKGKQTTTGPASNARLAKFVFSEILECGEGGPLPYNPKWRNLEEQSYLVRANLQVLQSYMEAHHQKGLNGEAVSDCLFLLVPVIRFLNAVDLTALVMEKEQAAQEKRGKGKAD